MKELLDLLQNDIFTDDAECAQRVRRIKELVSELVKPPVLNEAKAERLALWLIETRRAFEVKPLGQLYEFTIFNEAGPWITIQVSGDANAKG